jgi:hypothetical protein
MKHPRQKGGRIRRKAIELLQIAGFQVSTVERTGRFIKEKDMFGLFDIAGIKRGCLVLVQVTTNKPHKHTPFQDFSLAFPNGGIEYWQFVWKDNKGWYFFQYKDGEKLDVNSICGEHDFIQKKR